MIYTYVAVLLVGLFSGGTIAWKTQDWRHGAEQNAQDREERAREETRQAAQQGAAEAIAALKPVNTTIVQKVQREVQNNVVYRDCKLPADGLRLANEAITGRPDASGGGGVPGAVAPAR